MNLKFLRLLVSFLARTGSGIQTVDRMGCNLTRKVVGERGAVHLGTVQIHVQVVCLRVGGCAVLDTGLLQCFCTVVVQVEDRVKHALYGKVLRRTSKLKAHDEQNAAGVGDLVLVSETRPLSATKRWRIVK